MSGGKGRRPAGSGRTRAAEEARWHGMRADHGRVARGWTGDRRSGPTTGPRMGYERDPRTGMQAGNTVATYQLKTLSNGGLAAAGRRCQGSGEQH